MRDSSALLLAQKPFPPALLVGVERVVCDITRPDFRVSSFVEGKRVAAQLLACAIARDKNSTPSVVPVPGTRSSQTVSAFVPWILPAEIGV